MYYDIDDQIFSSNNTNLLYRKVYFCQYNSQASNTSKIIKLGKVYALKVVTI